MVESMHDLGLDDFDPSAIIAAAKPAAKPQAPQSKQDARPASKPVTWTLPGFGPLTRITTSFGEVHAQALRERDMVKTKSGEFKPIVWIDRMVLEEAFLKRHPDAQPVLIRAGALGRGLPRQDILLSPRQKLDAAMNKLPGTAKYASDLLHRPGVFRKAETAMTYTMFHLGGPELVQTERVWVPTGP